MIPEKSPLRAASGELVTLSGETWYVIRNVDALPPFLMSIASDSDHWMFVSSLGGLTAGRKSAEHALFPYVTDDKIHDAHHHTGPLTVLLTPQLWEPFSNRYEGVYHIQRNLYKHLLGHQVRFEEVNHDLGLRFSYLWQSSERFGIVRQVSLTNESNQVRTARILDGIRNILPCGTTLMLQTERSTLLDAYKRNEHLGRLCLYSLSSHVVDRPVPAESLQCTTVWSTGIDADVQLLSERQVDAFRRRQAIYDERDIRAARGACLIVSGITLMPGQSASWAFGAALGQGYPEVATLAHRLDTGPAALLDDVAASVAHGTQKLRRIIGLCDGFQCTGKPLSNARHVANTLFNVMRGGTPANQYRITADDFVQFVRARNRPLAASLKDRLPKELSLQALHAALADDPQLRRLSLEYLPLTFSRRHGDPSRPWNRFSVNVRHTDGSQRLDYEGNWRDIFQNWEALALSYPGLVAGMICAFVNASTADGHNPYRITRAGIDWEVPDPGDPWAHIGYWGDHQTVYLLRLLLIAHAHYPDLLPAFLDEHIFAYANIPYRIKPYAAILANPHETITYDAALSETIEARVRRTGADGKLIWNDSGKVYQVTLAEKLLVSLCARLSNFIPGAGIWMNTQRPEWNDANNALVGRGISVVTLCHLRPMLVFCRTLFGACGTAKLELSEEVAAWLEAVSAALMPGCSDRERMDALGMAASRYRQGIYANGFTGKRCDVCVQDILGFLSQALRLADATIADNRRADGLYHAYNLFTTYRAREIAFDRLPLMLEGQAAALSSGLVDVQEAIRLLRALRQSALWREHQKSYVLYPDRRLPPFVDKGVIPQALVTRASLLLRLIRKGDFRIAGQTPHGVCYFNPGFRNQRSVDLALDDVAGTGYADDVARERQVILDIFEEVFHHKAFTGRSGTFFKYEGLGCIYWHMVSKLLLAVQEVFYRGVDGGADAETCKALAALYYELREGLGDSKTPSEYGAFPTDPYSHTPAYAGAQQPGMTGQVKEDIIGRWHELGVRIRDSRITFSGALLRRSEFLDESSKLVYYTAGGKPETLALAAGTLGFTYIQVPVVYHLSERTALQIRYSTGERRHQEPLILSAADSRSIFQRSGRITRLDVHTPPQCL